METFIFFYALFSLIQVLQLFFRLDKRYFFECILNSFHLLLNFVYMLMSSLPVNKQKSTNKK